MKGWRLGFLKLAFMVIALSLTIGSMAQNSKTPSENLNPGLSFGKPGLDSPNIEGLPLFFEVNKGQVDLRVKVLSRGRMSTLYLTPSEVVWELNPSGGLPVDQKNVNSAKRGAARLPVARPAVLRMKFKGGKTAPEIIGEELLPGKSHYYVGSDPEKWHTNVPQFARGRYKDIYPGVDVVFYGNQRKLEFDLIVAAGRDPKSIKLAFDGAEKLKIDSQGNLVVRLGEEEILFHKPYCYQGSREEGREIDGRFGLLNRNSVGFEVAAYDPGRPLIIDPSLSYSTLIGGSKYAFAQDFWEDDDGNIYFAGSVSEDGDFTVDPYQGSFGGVTDGYFGKLNAAGTAVVYATYLGGSDRDEINDIAADKNGNAYITGATASTNFPLKNPIQATLGGTSNCKGDAFVAKLNSDGSALLYSTYLGGSKDDQGQGIAVDVAGNAYVMGYTDSSNFPTKSAFKGALTGEGDAFLAKLNSSGSALVYSTYLGGSGSESSYGFGEGDVAVDETGCAYLTGTTTSGNFPLKNAFQSSCGGGYYDAFIAKFNPSGSDLIFSTYLGGDDSDNPWAIAVAPNGNVGVTGYTYSANFPTRNPYQAAIKGNRDVFVTVFSPSGSSLIFSTYLGGTDKAEGDEMSFDIAFSPTNTVCVCGGTSNNDFPLASPLQSSFQGGSDAFVSIFSADGKSLTFSSYLGGNSDEGAYGVGFNAEGNLFVGGPTGSTDFPLVNALYSGGSVFIARIRMQITGPVPKLDSISPTSATAGGAAFTLSVKGSDFVKGCYVSWDGSKLKTTFKSEAELTAEVTAANLSVGNAVQVRVQNPGGGVSNGKTCNVADYALSSSPNSVTVAAGQSATYTIKAASKFGTWNQSVTLSCSGLPSLCTSSFSSAGGTPGTGGVTSTLTIKTTAPSAAGQGGLMGLSSFPFDSSWLVLLGLIVLLLPLWRRLTPKVLRPAWIRGGLLVLLLALFISCESKGGGGGNNNNPTNPGTPKGTYAVKVSGQSGALTRSIDMTLVVN